MNILPKKYSQFKQKEYWNKFFKQLKNTEQQFFQWYGNYNDFKSTLKTVFKQLNQKQQEKNSQLKIFHVGCGKSTFGEDIQCDYPSYQIVNTDYSEQIINDMIKRSKQLKLKCIYETCDMLQPLNQKYKNRFNIVLDKGTLDAILPEQQQSNIAKIKNIFFRNVEESINKQKNGTYMIVSMLQPFVLRTILEYFYEKENFRIQIYESHIKNSKMQPFLLNILRKAQLKQKTSQITIILLSKKQIKLKSIQETLIKVSQLQQNLDYIQKAKKLVPNQHLIFNIASKSNPQKNRYTLQIVDESQENIIRKKNTCSVFIVPQGKQSKSLFCTSKGLKMFIQILNTSRVIIVKLVIGNVFKSLAQVKAELNGIIQQFIQEGCQVKDVPYLTDGDEIGVRKYGYEDPILYIQQSLSDGEAFRRVILKNNTSIYQTQFKLIQKSVKEISSQSIKAIQEKTTIFPKKKGFVTAIDEQYLDEGYCRIVLSGIQRLFNDHNQIQKMNFLFLGGGGFAIPKFIFQHYKQAPTIEIVQIQKSLCQQQVYPFFQIDLHVKSQKFKIINQDAYKFVEARAKGKNLTYDCIVLDISGDQLKGQSLPPELFFSFQFIQNCYKLLSDDGVLVVNVIKKGFFKNDVPNLIQTKLFFPVYVSYQEQNQNQQEQDCAVLFLCKRKPNVQKMGDENVIVIKEEELTLGQVKGKSQNSLGYEWQKQQKVIMIHPKIQKDENNQFKQTTFQNMKVIIQTAEVKKKQKKKK